MADFFAYSQSSIRAKPRIRQPNASLNFNAPITVSHRQICNRFYNLFSEEKNIPKPDCPPPQPRCYRRNNYILLYTDIQALQPSCSSPVSRGTIPAASSNPPSLRRKTRADNSKGPAPERSVRTNILPKTLFSCLPKERKQRHNSVAFILTVPESPLHLTNAVVFRHSVRTIFWEV